MWNNYNFKIRFRPGRTNFNADALSRLPVGEPGLLEESDVEVVPYTEVVAEVVVALCSGAAGSANAAEQSPSHCTLVQDQWSGMTAAAWSQAQQQVLLFLQKPDKPTATERAASPPEVMRILKERDRLFFQDGVYFWRPKNAGSMPPAGAP